VRDVDVVDIVDVFSPVVAPLSSPGPATDHGHSPHVLLTTGVNGPPPSASSSAGTGTAAGSTAIPVQHLLIPVSVGNGLQQLISIPLSLAAGAGNHIQLLATSSGHLIAANMAAALQQPTASHAGTKHSPVYFRQQVCRSCLLSGRNASWPRACCHLVNRGKYADGPTGQTDG